MTGLDDRSFLEEVECKVVEDPTHLGWVEVEKVALQIMQTSYENVAD
jgi:hypothetical protein